MNTTKLHYFRKDYIPKPLLKKDLNSNPFQQFLTWFELAKNANFIEPNAMNLSTVGSNGQPSSRIVLLKSFSENGFVFFTNYESKKGKQIEENPFGAILFYWDQLDKEVRIEGRIIKTSKEGSDEYFESRPFGNKIGALISKQSSVLPDDHFLEEQKSLKIKEFEDKKISRPDYWGGYILIPHLFEFWQGQPDRLHDRFQYKLEKNNWLIERLSA